MKCCRLLKVLYRHSALVSFLFSVLIVSRFRFYIKINLLDPFLTTFLNVIIPRTWQCTFAHTLSLTFSKSSIMNALFQSLNCVVRPRAWLILWNFFFFFLSFTSWNGKLYSTSDGFVFEGLFIWSGARDSLLLLNEFFELSAWRSYQSAPCSLFW